MTSPRDVRTADHPIDPQFLDRWSPRAFDGSAITAEERDTLFEAARWAPSSGNAQPWRFLYAHRDTPAFERFLDVLVPNNRSWARNASLGILALSETTTPAKPGEEAKPSPTHSFDAGAAWMSLALQAMRLGLHTHGMAGIDWDRARADFAVPDALRIECAIVVGRQADKAILPEPLQAREVPSGRKPIAEFAFEGELPAEETAR